MKETTRPRIGPMGLGGLVAALALSPVIQAQTPDFTEEQLKRIEGDYTVTVYPQAFGFFLKDGKLHLRMGGIESGGGAVALIVRADGKFAIEEDHPNAFQFALEGDEVKFFLWSGTQSFPGTRAGGAPAEAAVAAAAEPAPTAAQEEWPRDGRTRSDVLTELSTAERSFQRNADDIEARLTYGRLLFENGEFWQARTILDPLTKSPAAPTETLNMAAKLHYLTGQYDQALALYDRMLGATGADVRGTVMTKVNKLFAYYQQDRFDKINQIEFPAGVQLPNATLAGEFEQNPYRLEWHNDEKRSVVPFYITDPLPVFVIEVKGVPIEVIFDTGGDMLILDTEIAGALGIESVAKAMGTFGGGKQSEVGFGKVDAVRIGDVTMHGVPVMTLPTKRFSVGFEPYRIGGIVGTAFMRQFLGSLDYANNQLVLRERSPDNAKRLRAEIGRRLAAEIPFVLDATHLMMARGSINDKDGLTFFMDSGLASENMLTAPIQTLQYVGIPVPETTMSTEGGGGGGGKWASGQFPVERIGLGPLVQTGASGEYGARRPASYWSDFYIVDGLLSHRFLRQYASWTLDFDSMTYVFERANTTP